MIYSETIENEPLWAEFGRQKNTADGEWYGLYFMYKDQDGVQRPCDNDEWIIHTLIPMVLDKRHEALRRELGVDWDKKDFKLLRKLVNELFSLGWL
jgi:hypothetical protein